MGSEKLVTQTGKGVSVEVICNKEDGVDVCVGNGVLVNGSTSTTVDPLAESEGVGFAVPQAIMKIIMLVDKKKSADSRMILISCIILF